MPGQQDSCATLRKQFTNHLLQVTAQPGIAMIISDVRGHEHTTSALGPQKADKRNRFNQLISVLYGEEKGVKIKKMCGGHMLMPLKGFTYPAAQDPAEVPPLEVHSLDV